MWLETDAARKVYFPKSLDCFAAAAGLGNRMTPLDILWITLALAAIAGGIALGAYALVIFIFSLFFGKPRW